MQHSTCSMPRSEEHIQSLLECPGIPVCRVPLVVRSYPAAPAPLRALCGPDGPRWWGSSGSLQRSGGLTCPPALPAGPCGQVTWHGSRSAGLARFWRPGVKEGFGLTGNSSQVSRSTELGSQAITIHCRSIACVSSVSTFLLMRICPLRSILLTGSRRVQEGCLTCCPPAGAAPRRSAHS